MQPKKYIIVANWKMYFSYAQARAWLEKYHHDLAALASTTEALVLCPSFEALETSASSIKHSPLILGAQDCSAYESGAFTGQVSAQSLAQLGCQFCLVAHSETYGDYKQSPHDVSKKISLLFKNGITPILCVGETLQEHQNNMTRQSILTTLDSYLHTMMPPSSPLFIAYEPVWAIGSGAMPSPEELQNVMSTVGEYLGNKNITARLLYGGSVNPNTVTSFKNIQNLDGFLLGKASTDFQELKKVVSLLHE